MKKPGIAVFSVLLAFALLLSACGVAAGEGSADLKALYEEGRDYWQGVNGKAFDREAARERFRAAADGGYADAWFYLGKAALASVDEDRYETAMACYEKGAELGSLLCLCGQAQMYASGKGVEIDYARAKALYEQALAAGCVEANGGLGEMYLYGKGVEVDGRKAVACLEKVLDTDDLIFLNRALTSLAWVYKEGIGVEQDNEKALEMYRIAAETGDSSSCSNLGDCYYYGDLVEQDCAEAIKWYEKAAEKGNTYDLAVCYYEGKGVERDYGKAMELFLQSLTSGVSNMSTGANKAFLKIGYMYEKGWGVGQDYVTALDWYLKGARDGDPTCMRNAAIYYQYGWGTEKNWARAAELYEQAAIHGSATSYGDLGRLYQDGGEGIPQDTAKAIYYYEKGAELGSGYCYGQLGWLYGYSTGLGIETDVEKARGYYEKGAELGQGYSYERLGKFYEDGTGVEKDLEKAVEYYLTALERTKEEENETVYKRTLEALERLGKTVKTITPNEKKVTLLSGAPAELSEKQLTVAVAPETAHWQDVTWTSSDENVAAVDASGVVRAVSAGKATITAATTQPDARAKPAQVQVVVNQAVTGIKVDQTAVTVPVKKNVKIKATVQPANAANKKLSWASSDENIAAVNTGGQVTGKAPGTAVITVSAADGGEAQAMVQVTVIQPVAKITAQEKNLTLSAGETAQITFAVQPENATDPTVAWTSGNEAVATVDAAGTVTAVGAGKCDITGTAADGSNVKVQVKVTVK